MNACPIFLFLKDKNSSPLGLSIYFFILSRLGEGREKGWRDEMGSNKGGLGQAHYNTKPPPHHFFTRQDGGRLHLQSQ